MTIIMIDNNGQQEQQKSIDQGVRCVAESTQQQLTECKNASYQCDGTCQSLSLSLSLPLFYTATVGIAVVEQVI